MKSEFKKKSRLLILTLGLLSSAPIAAEQIVAKQITVAELAVLLPAAIENKASTIDHFIDRLHAGGQQDFAKLLTVLADKAEDIIAGKIDAGFLMLKLMVRFRINPLTYKSLDTALSEYHTGSKVGLLHEALLRRRA